MVFYMKSMGFLSAISTKIKINLMPSKVICVWIIFKILWKEDGFC